MVEVYCDRKGCIFIDENRFCTNDRITLVNNICQEEMTEYKGRTFEGGADIKPHVVDAPISSLD